MPRRKKRKYSVGNPLGKISSSLEEDTKHSVLSVIFFFLGIFLILAIFGIAGIAGERINAFMKNIFGVGFILLPISFFLLAFSFWKSERPHIVTTNTAGILLFLLSGLGLIDLIFPEKGGVVGLLVKTPFVRFFETYVSALFFIALLIIGVLIISNTKLSSLLSLDLLKRNKDDEEVESDEEEYEEDEDWQEEEGDEYEEEEEDEDEEDEDEKETRGLFGFGKRKDSIATSGVQLRFSDEFNPPPLSLLEKDKGRPGSGDIKANANIIKRTLQNFKIDIEMDEVSIGPSITRYAIKPAEGVRLSRIVALQNDLALALAAHPLRIEAPIPGKSLVGIEIPNSKKSLVGIASLIGNQNYSESNDPLLLGLGRGVTGGGVFSNLAKAPHMLVAGATGAGKSVTIHSIITSLLYRNSPENLRFIMIDPKRVELTLYNGIPHLLTPVITNPKKAILSLKWAIKEMERRYSILEAEKARDIQTYHKNVLEPEMEKAQKNKETEEENLPEPMPYIVIIIDELADIMTTYPKELESSVVRLAQMSRAVGIHLILSTQRPSVNIITGLIKANIPSRIALQVASQIDSRTILDQAGAEKLLGAGDMLYLSGEMSKPIRLQSPFVSEEEVKKVVKYYKKEYEDELPSDLNLEEAGNNGNMIQVDLDAEAQEDDADDLYEDARDLVIQTGKASTSYLQRRLGLGYSRAARIIDMLEERGVVGPSQGAKPREVYKASTEPEEEEYEN